MFQRKRGTDRRSIVMCASRASVGVTTATTRSRVRTRQYLQVHDSGQGIGIVQSNTAAFTRDRALDSEPLPNALGRSKETYFVQA